MAPDLGRAAPGPARAAPDPAPARRRLASGAAALAVLGVCSLPWLIPSLLRTVYASPAGVSAFAARADTPFGSLGSLLMLGGEWNAQTVPAGYGGGWSVLWLALVIAASGSYLAFGLRSHRWPGLGFAAVAGLALASIGVTGPGRDLLRALTSLWPGVAVLRDGQQFVAPLALAEALGAGLLAAWVATPGPLAWRRRPAAPGRAPPHRRAPTARSLCTGRSLTAPVPQPPGRTPRRPGWAWPWRSCSRRCSCCPGWPGEPPDGCAPSGIRRAGWPPPARSTRARPRGSVLLLPWAAYRNPAWNGGHTLLDPWPRLLARPVIWNDGARVGAISLQPDDPAARRWTPFSAGAPGR